MGWMGAFLVIGVSCRRGPAWLLQAPLVGYRYTDDAGFSGYLPQPPRRVAVLTPAALGLWKAANLPTITLIGCNSLGDDYQTFYLACVSYQPPQRMGFRIQDYAVRKTYQQDFELALPGKAR